jgi:hypothetical protein
LIGPKVITGNDLRRREFLPNMLDMDVHEIQKQIDQVIQQLVALREQVAADGGSLPPEAAERLKNRICLNCGEPIPAGVTADRGCHHSCAKSIRRKIGRGELTETRAVSLGMWAPPNVAGRPLKSGTKLAEYVAAEEKAEYEAAASEWDEVNQTAVNARRKKKATSKKTTKAARRKKGS